MNLTLVQLVPTLQLAVGPVILISGVGLLILVLFLAVLLKWELGVAMVCLFALGQLALIGSMIGFLREIALSLEAVRLETQGGT